MILRKSFLRVISVVLVITIQQGKTYETGQWLDVEDLSPAYEPQIPIRKNIKPRQAPVEALAPIPIANEEGCGEFNVNVDEYKGPELVRPRRMLWKKFCKKKLKKWMKKKKDDDHEEKPKKECCECECKKSYSKCECKKSYGGCGCKDDGGYGKGGDDYGGYSKDSGYGKGENKITVKPIIHLVPISQPSYGGGCNKGCDNGYVGKGGYGGGKGGDSKKTAQITKVDVMTYAAPVKGGSDCDGGSYGGGGAGYSGVSHGYEAVSYGKGGGYDKGSGYSSNNYGGGGKGYGNDYGYAGSKITALITPADKKNPVKIYKSNSYKPNTRYEEDFEYV